MAIRDTRTEWLRVQMYRQMSPEERVLVAARMFDEMVAIVRSSVLDRQPGIASEELDREVRRRVLPRGLADLAAGRGSGRDCD
ncbi:MAG: hypothetical protein HY331_11855 [Chloroflexi bacterium]|nr:hypothetical protein [Chloroflexota bacterium]